MNPLSTRFPHTVPASAVPRRRIRPGRPCAWAAPAVQARAAAGVAAGVSVLALLLAAPPARAQGGARAEAWNCLIEPSQRLELRSVVEGRIEAIRVERGAEVRRGQVLVELESAAERAALEAARYRATMDGALRSAQARLAAGREKLRRRDELVDEKFVAVQDRDDAAAEVQLAQAALQEATENRRLAEIEARRLAQTLEQRRIRSPVDGVVTDRLQQVGEIAQTGEGARPVLRLAQVHPLRVEVNLPVAMVGRLRPGSRGTVQAEPPLDGRWPATVTHVDKVVDSASGTFRVRLELPNPRGELPAGVKCSVTF